MELMTRNKITLKNFHSLHLIPDVLRKYSCEETPWNITGGYYEPCKIYLYFLVIDNHCLQSVKSQNASKAGSLIKKILYRKKYSILILFKISKQDICLVRMLFNAA